MKKFLLLTVLLVLLACTLAIFVSADGIVANTISSETYGTVYQLSADPGLDEAHKYVSTLNNIENKGKDTESLSIMTDGTYYYVFPSSYLIDEHTNGKFSFTLTMGAGANYSSNQKGINDVFAEWAEAEGVTLPTFEQTGTWGSTKINSLVRFVVPTDIIYFDASHCLLKGNELVEVVFNHSVKASGGIFADSAKLTTVKGFDLVTNFSKTSHTFRNCTALVSVKLPKDTTAIGEEVFYNCTSFTGVENWDEIKGNIATIGRFSFHNCDSLSSISLPSIKTIATGAFSHSAVLETVDFTGAPLTSISDAFRNCPMLSSMTLPETVTSIGRDAFHGCSSLAYINVPRDCTELGPYAFNGCSSLKVVDMTNAKSLKSTGQNTFSGTIIEELVFPEGFESFGGVGAGSLKVLSLPNSTTTLGGMAWTGVTEFVVPLGVTTLGAKQFDYCGSLATVTIHKGVTSISLANQGTFFGTSPKTIIYTGSEDDAVVEQIRTALPNATIIFADQCETYFGGHAWSGNSTMQKVDFFKDITFADNCTREGCGYADIDPTKTIKAIFEWKGYSASTYGETLSITQGFGINRQSVEAYKAYAPDFDFGIFATVNKAGTAYAPDIESEDVINIKFDRSANNFIDVKVTGIPANKGDALIVFCAYVTDGENTYYLDGGVTAENVTGASYNSIVNN